MNDENDKPKTDDGWGMTMPHLRYEKEKNADDFSDEFAPHANRAPVVQPDDDWAMTTPNINLANQQTGASTDFDKTALNVDIPADVRQYQTPPHAPTAADDWEVSVPNVKLPTAPDEKQDDWEMNVPANAPKSPRKDEWSMPAPVFRVSEGENLDDVKRTAAFNLSALNLEEFDKNGPYFKPSATPSEELFEKPPPNFDPPTATVPEQFSEPPSPAFEPSAAQTAVQPVAEIKTPDKKKMSKIPFVIGGLLAMFLFAGVFLGGVYFLFFNKPVVSATKSEPVAAEKQSDTTAAPLAMPEAKPTAADLPKQIEYKGAMVLVEAGEFTMGSDADADESKPAHPVVLPAYYIDKTEVTNAEYKAFCDATGKPYPPNPHLEENYFANRPNAPVVGVSFADAKSYAEWAGKRLPSEAEWEKAASWDDLAKSKRDFPWGDDFQTKRAAFGVPKISDVGDFPGGASPSGALDMAGNVLEWVDAYFQPYPGSPGANAEFGEKNRVVRGGHFASKSTDSLKTTKRIYIPPDVASGEDDEKLMAAIIGFRCAIAADDRRLADVLPTQGK